MLYYISNAGYVLPEFFLSESDPEFISQWWKMTCYPHAYMPLSISLYLQLIITRLEMLLYSLRAVWECIVLRSPSSRVRVDGEQRTFVAKGNNKRETEREREKQVPRERKRERQRGGNIRRGKITPRCYPSQESSREMERRSRVSAPSPTGFEPAGVRTRSDYCRRDLKDRRACTFPWHGRWVRTVDRRENVRTRVEFAKNSLSVLAIGLGSF